MRFVYNISFLIFAVFYNTSCGNGSIGSGSSGRSGSGGGAIPEIKYSINLDDKYKTKTEGNNFYYKIPVGTKLIISSKRDNKLFDSSWSNNIRGGVMNGKNGNLFSGESSTLEYTSDSPLTIIAKGEPNLKTNINGLEQYPYEDKTFNVEWAVFPEQELKPEQITSGCLEMHHNFNSEENSINIDYVYNKDNGKLTDLRLKFNKLEFKNTTSDGKFIDFLKAIMTCQIKIEGAYNTFEVPCILLSTKTDKNILEDKEGKHVYLASGEDLNLTDCEYQIELEDKGINLNDFQSSKVNLNFFIGGVDSEFFIGLNYSNRS